MKKRLDSIITLIMLALLGGCASENINLYTAANYAKFGDAAVESGDWNSARRNYGRALANVEAADGDARTLANLNYEYGRAAGVTCHFDDAEEHLAHAYQLSTKIGGPAHLPLIELAWLNHDRKRYAQAVSYYQAAIPLIEKLYVVAVDPIGYADFLDGYAQSLDETGKKAEAGAARDKASQLRRQYPGRQSLTARTPYGTRCAR